MLPSFPRSPLYTLCVVKQFRSDCQAKSIIMFCALMLTPAPSAHAEGIPGPVSSIAHSRQLIVVTAADWNSVKGVLRRYERTATGKPWWPVGDAIPVVVGSKGMGWDSSAAPIPARSPDDPVKHEGDRKAPAGIFHLGAEFGFTPQKPAAWKMPYLALTPTIECVDDSNSKFYNRIVDRSAVTPDWSSSEHMLAVGEYYRWGVVVEQNPGAVPQGGSCVFLHIWGGDGGGTEGCTAMSKPDVETVLEWLRPAAKPLLVQMPLGTYRQAEKDLDLPLE
jgi:L,D-peptidoglycan transpeptidase YkuD (ErfK/YbiS/YcfS/YnhG family)